MQDVFAFQSQRGLHVEGDRDWLSFLLSRPDWLGARALDVVALLILIVHTTAPVAFLTKIAPDGQSPIAGYVWLAAALAGVLVACAAPLRTLILGLKMLPFVLLTGWIFLSITWSISSFDSLRGAVYIAASHLTAISMAAQFSWKRLLILLNIALGLVVTVSVGLAAFAPELGQMQTVHPGAWSGLWLEKQFMGLYACHFLIAAVSLVIMDRRFWPVLLLAPVCVAGIIGATGRTAFLMSAIALATMPLVWLIQQGPLRAIVVSWLAVLGGCAAGLAVVSGIDWALRLLGRGSDLTGRVDVWREVSNLIEARPMTGYGYQAIWRTDKDMTSPYQWIAENSDFTPANAHSSWMDAQLGLGLPGLVLLVVCVGLTWALAIWRLRSGGPGVIFSVATLLALTSISFTESTLLNQMDLQWFLVVLIAAKLMAIDANEAAGPVVDDSGASDGDSYVFNPPPPALEPPPWLRRTHA